MVLWQEILIVLGCIVAGFMIGLLLIFLFRHKKLKLYSFINKESNFNKTESFEGAVNKPLNNRNNKSIEHEDPLEVLVKNHKNSINAKSSKQPIMTDVIGNVDIINHNNAPTTGKEEKPQQPVIPRTVLVTPGNRQLVEQPRKFNEQIISPEPAIINRKITLVTDEPEKTSAPDAIRGSEITSQKTAPASENQKVFLEPNKPEPEIFQPIATTPIERQKESPNSELIAELETNLAIATAPWANKLIPFQTKYWYSKHVESDLLLSSHYKELMPLYVDMGLANNIVWLATEIGHRSKELDESYIKLCSGVADGLKK